MIKTLNSYVVKYTYYYTINLFFLKHIELSINLFDLYLIVILSSSMSHWIQGCQVMMQSGPQSLYYQGPLLKQV